MNSIHNSTTIEAIKPIKSEQEYQLALKQMETVFHAKPNTPQGDILELLALVKYLYIISLNDFHTLRN